MKQRWQNKRPYSASGYLFNFIGNFVLPPGEMKWKPCSQRKHAERKRLLKRKRKSLQEIYHAEKNLYAQRSRRAIS